MRLWIFYVHASFIELSEHQRLECVWREETMKRNPRIDVSQQKSAWGNDHIKLQWSFRVQMQSVLQLHWSLNQIKQWCLRKLHDNAASIDFFIVGCRFMNSMWTGYFLARVNKSQAIPLNGNCSSKDLETWSQGALIIGRMFETRLFYMWKKRMPK